MYYTKVLISDTHVGAKKCRIKELNEFLESNSFGELHLVGDTVDIWRFRQALSLSNKKKRHHTKFFINLLRLASQGTKIFLYIGNHDIYLEKFMKVFDFPNVKIIETGVVQDSEGVNWFVMHGHQVDFLTKYESSAFIGKLGDRGYDVLIGINAVFNYARRKLGLKYFSLSKYVKVKFKKAAMFVHNFEHATLSYAKRNGYDHVITGHIHDPIEHKNFINCGCWTDESNLSFVADIPGKGMQLLYFKPRTYIQLLHNEDTESSAINQTETKTHVVPTSTR